HERGGHAPPNGVDARGALGALGARRGAHPRAGGADPVLPRARWLHGRGAGLETVVAIPDPVHRVLRTPAADRAARVRGRGTGRGGARRVRGPARRGGPARPPRRAMDRHRGRGRGAGAVRAAGRGAPARAAAGARARGALVGALARRRRPRRAAAGRARERGGGRELGRRGQRTPRRGGDRGARPRGRSARAAREGLGAAALGVPRLARRAARGARRRAADLRAAARGRRGQCPRARRGPRRADLEPLPRHRGGSVAVRGDGGARRVSTPTFAVVGHPNKGKSSIVSTLAQDDSVRIAPEPGTTTECRAYPMRVDGEVQYVLVDTPGFQRARRALEWMRARETHAGAHRAVVEAFVAEHRRTGEFPDECELLAPVLAGAGILYVADGARPYGPDFEAE